MILSALSLWKKFQISSLSNVSEQEIEASFSDTVCSEIRFSGRTVQDGTVEIFSRFFKPVTGERFPSILLLPDLNATRAQNDELAAYFVKRGFSVLVLDFAGCGAENVRTEYPQSLSYARRENAKLLSLNETADKTCWFEWAYTALYATEYLKSRSDTDKIGVVGIRAGGELTWMLMLSENIACGVPVNAAGWLSYFDYDKFAENAESNMSDERHRFIAGIEAQSYAPFVKCPVLMLCSVRDYSFDYDRAYDTFSRTAVKDGSAIVFCAGSGPCISPDGLKDLDLFLERHLKGREIFIPSGLNVSLKEEDGKLIADVELDEGGIAESAGVYYAETGEESESAYREWQLAKRVDAAELRGGKFSASVAPFKGAKYAFFYAYAKYLNGFKAVSKIVAKRFSEEKEQIKSRVIYSGEDLACFSVADHEKYAIGGIFLESEAEPKKIEGYGKIRGAYSPGGIRTYKISSPKFVANEEAFLEFDVYAKRDFTLKIFTEVSVKDDKFKSFVARERIKGGGKWKRIVLKANDFKESNTSEPLPSFSLARALGFDEENGEYEEKTEFAVTNILWL